MGLSESRPNEEQFPNLSDSANCQSIQPKKLRNPHVTILNEILIAKAKLDGSLEKENNEILQDFLQSFIDEMKSCDPVFKALFQKMYFTGSYYSDLRIVAPDEFDLNLVLKIPKGSNDALKGSKKLEKQEKNKKEAPSTSSSNLSFLFQNVSLQGTSTVVTPPETFFPKSSVCPKSAFDDSYAKIQHPHPFEMLGESSRGSDLQTKRQSNQNQINPIFQEPSIVSGGAKPKKIAKKSRNSKKCGAQGERHKFRENGILFQYHQQVPSYAKYKILDKSILEKVPGLSKLVQDGFLIPERVRFWLQGVVDKALRTYKKPLSISEVNPRTAGPSRNIQLIKNNGDIIDVDLVPTIECSPGIKPPGISTLVLAKVCKLECFLVPKPYRSEKQLPVNNAEQQRLWRTHYPDAEKKLLHGRGCAKSIIRLLKLLKTENKWDILASYYLKTIVMWMIIECSEEDHWSQDKMGNRFLDALRKLLECVRRREIKYLFSSRYNLLEKLSVAHAENIQNRLNSIIGKIEKDTYNLWEVFNCKKTFYCPSFS